MKTKGEGPQFGRFHILPPAEIEIIANLVSFPGSRETKREGEAWEQDGISSCALATLPRFLQGYRAQSFPSPAICSEVFHWLCLNSCYSKRFWLDLKILLLMNEKNIDDLVFSTFNFPKYMHAYVRKGGYAIAARYH